MKRLKVRHKLINDLSMTERQKLSKKLDEEFNKRFLEHIDKAHEIIMCNLFKLMVVALNEQCGFGESRIIKVLDGMGDLVKRAKDDEIFWEHVEKRIKQIMNENKYYLYFKDLPHEIKVDTDD